VKVLYGEGVETHTGPESCAATRDGRGEALTGEHVGQPLSGTVERLGVRWWAGYDRPSFWLVGDQGWGRFCVWWKPESRDWAEAST
jgi:hypothetical protein